MLRCAGPVYSNWLILIAALSTVGHTSSAQAAQITQSVQMVPIVDHVGSYCGGSTNEERVCEQEWLWQWGTTGESPLTIDRFDASLGQLTSVTFESALTAVFQTEYSPDVLYGPKSTRVGMSMSYFIFRGVGDESIGGGSVHESQVECAGPCFLDWSLEITDGAVFSEDLDWFVGHEAFGIGSESSLFASGGGTFEGFHPTVTLTDITVTYSYSPIPEPSTALLLGIGLAGLGIRRKR